MIGPQTAEFARAVSRLCGWLYFLAWSLSFYPQPRLNLRRRTTAGLTPDFPFLNVVGFTCYTLSTAAFLLSPLVRAQYAARHPRAPDPTVRANDLAFGVHAWLICVVTYSQFWPRLWRWESAGPGVRRRVTRVSLGVVCGGAAGVAGVVVLVIAGGRGAEVGEGAAAAWAWIDVIYALSYVKLVLTVFKYLPQAVANFRRKSTVGWSIDQVLLDLSGGLLSLLQLAIDSALQGDWGGLAGNPVKLGLGGIAILVDACFMVQHYVLYGPVEEEEQQQQGQGQRQGEVGGGEGAREAERAPLLPS